MSKLMHRLAIRVSNANSSSDAIQAYRLFNHTFWSIYFAPAFLVIRFIKTHHFSNQGSLAKTESLLPPFEA
ncbi:MAG: hypothetical protein U0798_12790 [Gemmataceae bacterium]